MKEILLIGLIAAIAMLLSSGASVSSDQLLMPEHMRLIKEMNAQTKVFESMEPANDLLWKNENVGL